MYTTIGRILRNEQQPFAECSLSLIIYIGSKLYIKYTLGDREREIIAVQQTLQVR